MKLNWQRQVKLWLYIVCICSLLRSIFFYQNLHQELMLPEQEGLSPVIPYVFQVYPGDSFTQVASRLSESGLLRNDWDLRLYARLSGQAAKIKAGEYAIEENTNALQLLQQMTLGQVNYHQIVLVEGWTIAQALDVIQANEFITSTINNNDKSALDEALNLGIYPEGLLFPDTYNFSRGASDIELLQRSAELLKTVLAEEWAGRAVGLPYKTPYEALIMASIVEKETGLASEREKIAGVFIRRMELGMRLQTDPTVIYGLGESFDGNLTRANLREDTPYNTYTNRGLPPTPIAIAGREAISASLHPEAGDSLYFVAKGDGSHYFSATLAEHNAAVRQYQLNQ